jgi:cardiolipin synthase
MARSISYRTDHTWEKEELFACAEDFFASLLDGIANAKHSIDMDYYIFDHDALGERVIAALLEAAKKPLVIRIMIDGLGSAFSAKRIASALSSTNITVQIFHPFPFSLNVFRWSNESGHFLHKFFHFFRRLNHRNHHKICIIDQQFLWAGSFNISAQHLSKNNGGNGWHDYGIKITDDNLQAITQSFNHLFTQQTLSSAQHYLHNIRSNLTEKLRRLNNNLLLRRISNAEKRIWICTAYFSPSRRVLRAIKKARKRNIDVRIIVPAISDIFFIPLLSRTYYKKLLKQGVVIYEYQPTILHAKLLLIDQQCMIGSTNFNHRSFHHDLELDIVLHHPDSITAIEQYLLNDMAASEIITINSLKKHRLQLFFSRFFRLFRYWL